MSDGIRVRTADLEIPGEGLAALLARRGGEVRLYAADLTVTQKALQLLLDGPPPGEEGEARAGERRAPAVIFRPGEVTLRFGPPGSEVTLLLAFPALHLEPGDGILRLRGGVEDGGTG